MDVAEPVEERGIESAARDRLQHPRVFLQQLNVPLLRAGDGNGGIDDPLEQRGRIASLNESRAHLLEPGHARNPAGELLLGLLQRRFDAPPLAQIEDHPHEFDGTVVATEAFDRHGAFDDSTVLTNPSLVERIAVDLTRHDAVELSEIRGQVVGVSHLGPTHLEELVTRVAEHPAKFVVDVEALPAGRRDGYSDEPAFEVPLETRFDVRHLHSFTAPRRSIIARALLNRPRLALPLAAHGISASAGASPELTEPSFRRATESCVVDRSLGSSRIGQLPTMQSRSFQWHFRSACWTRCSRYDDSGRAALWIRLDADARRTPSLSAGAVTARARHFETSGRAVQVRALHGRATAASPRRRTFSPGKAPCRRLCTALSPMKKG